MRIALIADIHGNLPALEAVLAELQSVRPDRLIVAGDVVDGGPDTAACWRRIRALGVPVIRGNHERYVFDYGTPRADPAWSSPQFAPLRFARSELSEAEIAELAALPPHWADPEMPDLLVVHASLRGDNDSIFPYTPDAQIDPMFEGISPAVKLIVRGHNHACSTREWGARRIVTTGSVGLPQDGNPAAQFLLLERTAASSGAADAWHVRHRAVRYDVGATLRRFRESGYLDQSGPLGRLFYREMETGTHQVVPFLRFYGAARARGVQWTLEETLRRFFDVAG
ncbi:MAG: metallophosphatase family protein [Opitutaceae bacterium]|jgi:predicted phosphodiesterase|nr:metallophosphatase family protein [Opitutaceae bacterium]